MGMTYAKKALDQLVSLTFPEVIDKHVILLQEASANPKLFKQRTVKAMNDAIMWVQERCRINTETINADLDGR